MKQLDARLLKMLDRYVGPVKIKELKRGAEFDCCYKIKTREGYYSICVEGDDFNTLSAGQYLYDYKRFNLIKLENKPKNYRELP